MDVCLTATKGAKGRGVECWFKVQISWLKLLDHEGLWPVLRLCLLKSETKRNVCPHPDTVHLYGLSPVWTLMCSVLAHAHLKACGQPFQGHFKGRSSKWTLRCCRRYLCMWKCLPHPFHVHRFRLCNWRSCSVSKPIVHPSMSHWYSPSGSSNRFCAAVLRDFFLFLLLMSSSVSSLGSRSPKSGGPMPSSSTPPHSTIPGVLARRRLDLELVPTCSGFLSVHAFVIPSCSVW